MQDQAEFHTPCSACGADLTFAPGQRALRCAHCGSLQEIPAPTAKALQRGIVEMPLASALRDGPPLSATQDHRTTSCPNCGALVEFDGERHASACPYCATPVVIDSGTTRLIKPQALVPFAITEAQARQALGQWLAGRWFAPGGLAEYARRGRRMQGIYTPFWTFDADTASRYRGQRGDHYYESRRVTVQVNGKSEQREERVRKTRWRPASGRVARFFDDLLILGARSLPPRHTEALAPWDLTALVPYRPDYLSGLLAEGYTIALPDAHEAARARMAQQIQADVRADIGGDEQRIAAIDTDWRDETFKHVLLPIWTAAYRYRGKSFRFVVNGQSGKVQGERPYSAIKIALAVLAALLALGLFLALRKAMG